MKNIKFLILMSIFLSGILTSVQADNQESLGHRALREIPRPLERR